MTQSVLMSRHQDEAIASTPGPQALWTLVGLSAIPMWAIWPLLAEISKGGMPIFQFSVITYGVGALTLFGLRLSAPGKSEAQPRTALARCVPALMVSVGLLLSSVFFLFALRFIPAAQANLLVYLWPVMVVVLGGLLRLIALRKQHVFSVILAFCGAVLVLGPSTGAGSWPGISLGVAGGLAWAVFCVYRLWQGANAPEALAPGFALSAMIAAVIHFSTEPTLVPPPAALLAAILTGVIPLALGNLAWDHGIRRGDRVLLAVAAYGTPLISALILVPFGFAEATLGLLVGGGLIVAAGIMSTLRRSGAV